MNQLTSERLILRQWVEPDRQPFATLNADPAVMRYFATPLIAEQSHAQLTRLQNFIELNGWGFWAVEHRISNQFLGFVGLSKPSVELPFSPCVEIGWRLARQHWGQGYATEAAQRALKFAFDSLNLREVVSYTASSNTRSIKVMQVIGMRNSGENFIHPLLPKNHHLAEHVLYRLSQSDWQALA